MPHLHDDKSSDNDDASRASDCSKSDDIGPAKEEKVEQICPVAENAANQLLSLAVIATEHAKARAGKEEEIVAKESPRGEEAPAQVSSYASLQESLASKRQIPTSKPPGMVSRLGMVVYHPTPPPHMHGFHGPSRPIVYHSPIGSPGAGSPGGVPRSVPMRRPGRGGFPMWAGPRPPYHPHHLRPGAPPSPMPPAFRGPVPPPYIISRQYSTNDEKSGPTAGHMMHPKRLSLDSAASSTPKKSKVEKAGDGALEAEPCVSTRSRSHDSTGRTGQTPASDKSTDDVQECQNQEKTRKTTLESVVVEKKSFSTEDHAAKKQRIISPASSNEYQKCEHDEEMTVEGDESNMSLYHPGSPSNPYHRPPFVMGPPHPHVRGFHPGIRVAGRPYMTHAPMYARGPFPPGPGMYPPRSMSSRGRPGFHPAAMPPFFARGRMESSATVSPEQEQRSKLLAGKPQGPASSVSGRPVQQRAPVVRSSDHPSDTLCDVTGNANRCVPLTPPVPTKFWSDSDTTKDIVLPDFHRLVNFPDLLMKGRNGSGENSNDRSSPNALTGKKRCVMCGQLRVSATYVRSKKGAAAASDSVDEPTTVSATAAASNHSSHIIPRQNKGVCTACDVTVWVAIELDGLEIKWCKGCKNFRPWAAFGSKGSATKCVRCRDRQKEKYAMQKNANRRRSSTSSDTSEKKKTSDTEEMQPCGMALVAANGLRNLMNSV